MSGDGNGWVRCALGHRHWGRFGAAGVLVSTASSVLLQHRAEWTHQGGTWAVPGGARDSHEDAIAAALREAVEETSLDPVDITPYAEWVDDHGDWSYTTVLAHAGSALVVEPINTESTAMRWWPLDQVLALPLHEGFAAAWPRLRALIAP